MLGYYYIDLGNSSNLHSWLFGICLQNEILCNYYAYMIVESDQQMFRVHKNFSPNTTDLNP